jgi:aspartate ammonia-lyase
MTKEKKYRVESDLLGELNVPIDAYYGVQTQRGINNYRISCMKMYDFPDFIVSFAFVKKAAAMANAEVGALDPKISEAICQACDEIIGGALWKNFPIDLMQGGAGTSVNMNANEVIANRAIEILGHEKGEYQYCMPNDHVNCGQSTNDAYPTAIRYAVIRMNKKLVVSLERLITSFRNKAEEFKDAIKMGRTQLQDAVPMTSGQEFAAFANNLEEEVLNIARNEVLLHEINMGGTAIGTGLNAAPGYADLCTAHLSEITHEKFEKASDMIEATPDTGAYVSYSAALKRLAVKLSKICNDLRLMASGPRCGLAEINLPPMAPGSSIMPGKVNPVIPEVTNQVCFKVIGNDTTISFAAEAGQLQLNVMEPVITECLFESITWLSHAMDTLREKCVDGITINAEHNLEMVRHSIGIVTALNPYIGYKNSTKIAKEALATGKSLVDIVLEKQLLSKEQLDEILDPKAMLQVHKKFK